MQNVSILFIKYLRHEIESNGYNRHNYRGINPITPEFHLLVIYKILFETLQKKMQCE